MEFEIETKNGVIEKYKKGLQEAEKRYRNLEFEIEIENSITAKYKKGLLEKTQKCETMARGYHEWRNERTLLLRKNDTLSADLNSMKEKFITFVIAFIIGLIIAIMLFIFRNDIEEHYIKAKNSEL